MKMYVVILLLFPLFYLNAGEWHVDKSKANSAVYSSEVISFSFEGSTDKIDGYIYWEGEELFEKETKLYFEVDLNSLDSGIGKRDSDMREVLQTNKWHFATFDGRIESYEFINEDKTELNIVVDGKFFVNGVYKEMSIPGTIHLDKDEIRVKSNFKLLLADFEVEAPSLLAFVKVSEEIEINLDFFMKSIDRKD